MSNVLSLYDSGRAPKRGDLPPAPPGDGPPVACDPWAECPFVPLGKASGKFWFFDAGGDLVGLPAQAMGQWASLLELCGGRQQWLVDAYPAYDREGAPLNWFNQKHACAGIMARSGSLPKFDPTEPRRRHGLWEVPGGWALHLGHRVLWHVGDTVERRAGFREAGALWPDLPPRPAPPDPEDCATAADGQRLEALIASWAWEMPTAAGVLLGLTAVGMMGALAPWRAHGMLVGPAGCGKSTLLRMVANLNPFSRYLNDFTEAGLRQSLSETAAAMVLDEAEGDGEGDRALNRVIVMLRKASGQDGVKSIKGGSDHEARTFSVTASAILGTTLPPPLTPQDESRITTLALRPLATAADGGSMDIAAIEAEVAAMGLGVWGRVVHQVERVRALFRLLRQRLLDRGCSPRVADQLGVIAAARWVLVHDAVDDPASTSPEDDADAPLAVVAALIVSEDDALGDSAGNQALQRLLSWPVDMQGNKLTIGQALRRMVTASATLRRVPEDASSLDAQEERRSAVGVYAEMSQLLEAHGLKLGTHPLRAAPGAPAPPTGLYVVVGSHPRLLRAYDGTIWSGQRWGVALAGLPGAKSSREASRAQIGGGQSRCCWIPATTLRDLT
jgi:hypothetical protein